MLNGEAFSPADVERILTVKNMYPDNEDNNTEDVITYDKVFCLRINEVAKYFKDDDDMVAMPTEYIIDNSDDYEYLCIDEETGGVGGSAHRVMIMNVRHTCTDRAV